MAENKVVKGEVIRVLPDDSKPVGAGAVIQAAGHKPEASSAMDPSSEARCYRAIVAAVPLVVSVGHRPSLEAFHTHSLECEHESEPWRFRPLG